MRTSSVGIAREGYPFLALLALTCLVFALVGWCLPALAVLVLTWFSAHFFRDPERVTPTQPGLVVSAADGKVIRIEDRTDPLTGEVRSCMSVFMNVFNVHVNRSPAAGMVEEIRYYPGAFVNAALDKASTDNERCAYLVRMEDGDSFTMVQIAGLVARRIVCRAEEGDALARGERFGLIRFGSRVDLYLPRDYHWKVAVGDLVAAGETVVAAKG